jgi:hypothetical protein
MSFTRKPHPDEVEHLLRNAQLRDELEPYFDESIQCVNVRHLPTPVENEYLESMLEWEKAPVLPIRDWFEPPLIIPHPDAVSGRELSDILWETIQKLYEKRIVLDFTDHLSDRELYCLVFSDILPSSEKRVRASNNYLHWDCANTTGDPETWLRYYASPEEREAWEQEFNFPLPPSEPPPYPRQMPRHPL